MKRINQEKGDTDTFKIYRALEVKLYDHNSKICEIGEPGNYFYVIIRGEVGVLSPIVHDDSYPDYFLLYKFMTRMEKFLLNIEDSHSNIVKTFMDMIP